MYIHCSIFTLVIFNKLALEKLAAIIFIVKFFSFSRCQCNDVHWFWVVDDIFEKVQPFCDWYQFFAHCIRSTMVPNNARLVTPRFKPSL